MIALWTPRDVRPRGMLLNLEALAIGRFESYRACQNSGVVLFEEMHDRVKLTLGSRRYSVNMSLLKKGTSLRRGYEIDKWFHACRSVFA